MTPVVMVPHPHVRVQASILGGSPLVAGSHIPVRRIFAFYRDGVAVERICKRFSQIAPAKVLDALAFALDNPELIEADAAREQEILAAAFRRKP